MTNAASFIHFSTKEITMSRIKRIDNEVAIILTTPKGQERTAHVVNIHDPLAIVAGSLGGFQCAEITPLAQPTFDGAHSIVKTKGMPPWGPTVGTERVKESTTAILELFVEAGLQSNQPKIVPQGRVSKAANIVLLKLLR
jgi:hypothetical protein